MRSLRLLALAFVLLPPVAAAQTAQQPSSAAQTGPAPSDAGSVATSPGVNAMTQDDARARLEAHGYRAVIGLRKNTAGGWQGRALRNGTTQNVSVDAQGNVNPA